MLNKTISGKKSGQKGGHMYRASRLEGVVKNSGIKPKKKEKKA